MDRTKVDMRRITRSVKKACFDDMKKFHESYNLVTRNGDPGLKWDFINTNIEKSFKEDIYKTLLVKRGYWNQIVIYNLYDKRLYFVMMENRYKEVSRDNKRKNLHLIQMLGSVNEEDKSEAYRDLKQKLPEYVSKAEEYILITYEYNKNSGKCDFTGRKITSNFKCYYEEKWNSDAVLEEVN
ncbi:DUF5986 family protein [Paraclostridium bifermentans]|uniref:DUF5986 family protein n=1 Tax=Paraclostridium bifermentans TaxID=1490 RepID=UPI002149E34F|nr:DUF5986 family protein [Paraclostridium bifermentans]MCR1875132.1 DUF5986 family protein [Paraclostridium bifermentans]